MDNHTKPSILGGFFNVLFYHFGDNSRELLIKSAHNLRKFGPNQTEL